MYSVISDIKPETLRKKLFKMPESSRMEKKGSSSLPSGSKNSNCNYDMEIIQNIIIFLTETVAGGIITFIIAAIMLRELIIIMTE